MRWLLQYHFILILDALGMRLHGSCRWHATVHPFSAHTKCDVSFPDFVYRIFAPHASHGGPLACLCGGPGLVSIPALISRIRREWAGLVPPIGQKTTVGNDLALCWVSTRASSRVGLQWLEVLRPVEFGDVHFADAQR